MTGRHKTKRRTGPSKNRWRFVFSLLLLGFLFSAPHLFAQNNGTIEGYVKEADTGEALPNAQVLIVGTTKGDATNADGYFKIAGLPPGQYEIEARYIGFKTFKNSVTLLANANVSIDFVLKQAVINFDEIVVTGTAVETDKRSLGNTISTISTKELEDAPVKSLHDVLQGRAAGVQVLPSSGTAGTGASLRMRGMTSISQDNEPVVYVDGVRVDRFDDQSLVVNGTTQSLTHIGGQDQSRLSDFSPDEIERVEIVKGAAATTLYGTQAANGVIQIFTKRGRAGQTRITAQIEGGSSRIPSSFNNSLANSMLQTAGLQRYQGSISGGNEYITYFVSGRYSDDEGSWPTNFDKKYNMRANFQAFPSEKVDIQVSSGYVYNHAQIPFNDNSIYGLLGNTLLANPDYGSDDRPNGEPFTTVDQGLQTENDARTHRFTGSVILKYRPVQNLEHRMTFGLDATNYELGNFWPFGIGLPNYPEGKRTVDRRTFSSVTMDYAANYRKKLNSTISSTSTFGGEVIISNTRFVSADGEDFPGPGLSTITNAAVPNANEARIEEVNAGVFFQQQFGFAEKFFLTAGLRYDGNTAFGDDFSGQLYPKVSASYIFQFDRFPLFHNANLKLRSAYGQSGLQPQVFAKDRTYTANAVDNQAGLRTENLGNQGLKPERSQEIEGGFDLGLLNDRIGIEFTYYYQRTKDALVDANANPSSGFTRTQQVNIGEVENSGIEFGFYSNPIQRQNINLGLNLTLATNDNNVISLGGADPIDSGSINRTQEGYPIAALWHRIFEGYDADGNPIYSSQDIYLGRTTPNFWGSFRTTLTLFKRVTVSGLFDWSKGAYMYNNSKRFQVIFDSGVVIPTGADVPPELNPSYNGNFVEKADFARFREISVAYRFPQALLGSMPLVRGASLSVAARNIALFSDYSGADPEVNSYGQANLARGEDFFTLPQARSFISTLKVEF